MNSSPHPEDPIYKEAARGLLEQIREVCNTERERCGEVAESWPSEIRLFPVSSDTAEGVLYMPRAVPPVYFFQCSAQIEDGEIQTHIHGIAPLSQEVLELALDYQKRAAQTLFTCTCGHVIPKIMTIPIFFEDDEDSEEEDSIDAAELEAMMQQGAGMLGEFLTAEEMRIQDMVLPEEVDYQCPACGFKPNKRYSN